MKRYRILVLLIFGIVLALVTLFIVVGQNSDEIEPEENFTPTSTEQNKSAKEAKEQSAPEQKFAFPIDQFKERITKKNFGTFVSPQNSPVSPERFRGYHTAVDVEYGDISTDVPVFALADGKIVYSSTVSGYGGIFILEFEYNGQKHNALYGHIRPSSLPSKNRIVKKGKQIGLLGTGFSQETDNERRHLHFGIINSNEIKLLGYVQNQAELSGWHDPLSLYPQ